MKFLGEGEWKRKKHGPEYRRQWRKLHIGIDAKTLKKQGFKFVGPTTCYAFMQAVGMVNDHENSCHFK